MKAFKKIFAFTVVLAVFASFGSTGAVAANEPCPPHGPYEDRLVDISQGYEEHMVDARDSYGNLIYDSTGAPSKVICRVTWTRYYRIVYCTNCSKAIYDYRYEDEKKNHSCSYCPERGK